MAVRNFYVEANIDGRETTLGGGPRAKNGEMTVHVHQRADGGIERDAVSVRCRERDGKLTIEVYDFEGKLVYSRETVR